MSQTKRKGDEQQSIVLTQKKLIVYRQVRWAAWHVRRRTFGAHEFGDPWCACGMGLAGV